MRDSASWYIGCSRITELPSGERDENVVERRVVRGQRCQLEPSLLQRAEQRRQRAVELGGSQRQPAGRRPDRRHAAERFEIVGEIVRHPLHQGEFDHVLGAERRDQLAWRGAAPPAPPPPHAGCSVAAPGAAAALAGGGGGGGWLSRVSVGGRRPQK